MTFHRSEPFNDLPKLPPTADLETRAILRQTVSAARALSDLKGIAAKIPNQAVLVSGIVLQEARLSSEIENIVTTSDELYRAAASPEDVTDPQTKEVLRYREALWHGFGKLNDRPLSTNLFVEIVSEIRGVQMEIRRVPGTALKNQRGEVIYTPPTGEPLLREMLKNLEDFLLKDEGPDPLIRLAVMHYQFEAIHPFTDGNGRTGRILNILYLVERGLLDWPVMYLSQYILRNKIEYYRGLRAVTEEGAWEAWILFMLRAIEETAKETQLKVNRILNLMNETVERVKSELPKVYRKDLIEAIYRNPYCKIRFLEESGLGNRQTVSNYLKKLSDIGVLRPLKVGREMYYINDALLGALSAN